jgi:NRAMP (natural resistance-associated macrophage protein)-like metal ion transporter
MTPPEPTAKTLAAEAPPDGTAPARWRRHRGRPHPLRTLGRGLRVLGPGLVTGAADDDPSGIGTYSQAGAVYGPALLWLALYLLPLTIAVQEMCGRIGLVTGSGLAGVLRKHYGRRVLIGVVGLLFLANTINVGADLGAMAASTRLLAPDVPFGVLVLLFALVVLGLEIFIPYRHYARVLKVLTLSVLAYALTALIIQPDWLQLVRATLVPSFSLTPAFIAIFLGVLGTTISPYLFFWQASEEVEEEEAHHRLPRDASKARRLRALRAQLQRLRADTAFGMFTCNVTFWFIIVTASSTLHTHGITNITTAGQAAAALAPLVRTFPHAGGLTRLIFALGIVGTGLLAVPVLAGSTAYGIAETLGWREGLSQPLWHARGFYGVIAAATLIGLLLNFLGINPIQALIYAAILNGIVAVPLLFFILRVANDRRIMGDFTNGRLGNLAGGVTFVVIGVAAVAVIVSTFVH